MRKGLWLCAVVLLVASSSAQAQRRGPIFFGGVDPTQLSFEPIDTSASVVPIAQPQVRTVGLGFRLIDLLPRISLPGARPIFGRSVFPSESQLPNQDYLKAFNFRGPRPFSN